MRRIISYYHRSVFAAMGEERPKLRLLDMVPVQTGSGQAFLLRDPQALSPAQVALPADVAYLVSRFDGTRTVREAQVDYVRRFGTLITSDQINDVLRQLDKAYLLESERFRALAEQVAAEFRESPVRHLAHAGRSYPEAAGEFVSQWVERLTLAGLPEGLAINADRPAVIAPHYDLSGGADCYAAAYAVLAECPRPDVAVILGIAHHGGTAPFALTRKAFETPFGALETDEQVIRGLEESAAFDLYADELLHRDEHSIEFQAVLLHFLYREEADPPKIVPVLCGAYHRGDGELVDPLQSAPGEAFLVALRDTLAADSRRVAVIASADLSHIGARFGQPSLTQAHLDLARRHDMALLEAAQAGEAEGLYGVLERERDRYNVCGFPAIYGLLRALPITGGRLLSYRQEVEPQTQSCVSFASVALG
jgi:hypothetical protein